MKIFGFLSEVISSHEGFSPSEYERRANLNFKILGNANDAFVIEELLKVSIR